MLRIDFILINENTAGYPMSKDAITSKIKENQSASKKKKDQIEEDAERFSRQHCMLSPSMLGRHMHENDANRITSVRKTLSEIYRACQTPSITESSSEQMLTVEGVGKMNISNIKETIAKKMSEMIRLAECGDYAALTKHTTNGQLSVLESIKKSILANLKEAPAPISAAAVPVSPGITESKRSKSIYSRFFKE
jgi:restriction endonuclease